jgi:hypothetical protein
MVPWLGLDLRRNLSPGRRERVLSVGSVGQIIMGGRAHIVGIKAHGKGLMLSILRYANEVRPAEPYFDAINVEPEEEAVALAKQLVKAQSGKFEPEKMPDEYAVAIKELIKAKIEQRAPRSRSGRATSQRRRSSTSWRRSRRALKPGARRRCAMPCGSAGGKPHQRANLVPPQGLDQRARAGRRISYGQKGPD